MIFRQLFDAPTGTYSYLLARRKGGEALIIDPVLEHVPRYLKLLEELDLKLVKAVDTHLHADHVTGLGGLRDETHCITVMGRESKADVVGMRVRDGDGIDIDGLSLSVMHTPGHTDDSYSFALPDRVFTGDTLLIRGTGRTDFQSGDARAQYHSILERLFRLPDDTLVYPAHDYKGETVSTIGEERAHNPRLKVKSIDEYADLMASLKLPNPRLMDVAIPANRAIGLSQSRLLEQGLAVLASEFEALVGDQRFAIIDLREPAERRREREVPGSIAVPYPGLAAELKPGGRCTALAHNKRLVFVCSYGERSAMAVTAAVEAGLANTFHLHQGISSAVTDLAA